MKNTFIIFNFFLIICISYHYEITYHNKIKKLTFDYLLNKEVIKGFLNDTKLLINDRYEKSIQIIDYLTTEIEYEFLINDTLR